MPLDGVECDGREILFARIQIQQILLKIVFLF